MAPIIFQGVAKVLRSFLCKRDVQTPNNWGIASKKIVVQTEKGLRNGILKISVFPRSWFVYFKLDDVYKVKVLFIVIQDRTTGQHIYTLDLRFLKLLDYITCFYFFWCWHLLIVVIQRENYTYSWQKKCTQKKLF